MRELDPSRVRTGAAGVAWEWVRVALPSMLAVALFVLAAYGLFLPTFRDSILERKKDMLSQLTNTAAGILRFEYGRERAGLKTRKEAQLAAIERIRRLRYGPQLKDYFWIHDMHPRMVMHPYRPELNGKDLTGYKDPEGTLVFVRMVSLVKAGGHGYTPYLWQWKDDPRRIVPKLSHVRAFKPWNWVIGSGMYLHDVRAEVAALTRRLGYASATILTLIALLSLYIIRQGVRAAARRRVAEEKVAAYQGHLEELVEQRTVALASANTQLQQNISQLEKAKQAREQLIEQLQNALSKVKLLSGLLPICSSCKRIRDEEGRWNRMEQYIEQKSEAEFSHGLCTECAEQLYGYREQQSASDNPR